MAATPRTIIPGAGVGSDRASKTRKLLFFKQAKNYKDAAFAVSTDVLHTRDFVFFLPAAFATVIIMNPDAYTMIGECPVCKAQTGISCSKKQALDGEPVEVYSATCDHHWALTKEQSAKLRERLSEPGS